MPTITASASRDLDAPAVAVYAAIADYQHGHPHIVPPRYFSGLTVLNGGVGAGTEIRFQMHLLGGTHTLHARIEEPEPGRVLREVYPSTGMATTFRIDPLDGGARAAVTIASEWEMTGMRAQLERWFLVPLLQKIFAEELEILERFARSRTAAAHAPASGIFSAPATPAGPSSATPAASAAPATPSSAATPVAPSMAPARAIHQPAATHQPPATP